MMLDFDRTASGAAVFQRPASDRPSSTSILARLVLKHGTAIAQPSTNLMKVGSNHKILLLTACDGTFYNCIMTDEVPSPSDRRKSRRERFLSVAERRTREILKKVRLLGNCSNRSAYHFEKSEIDRIFDAIEQELALAKERFYGTRRLEEEFSLRPQGGQDKNEGPSSGATQDGSPNNVPVSSGEVD